LRQKNFLSKKKSRVNWGVTGVWADAYHADRDVPAQRDAQQTWLKHIRDSQEFVKELDPALILSKVLLTVGLCNEDTRALTISEFLLEGVSKALTEAELSEPNSSVT
jgi:hypothetical protein